MEKPDSSIFSLTKCGKKFDFNIGDHQSKSQTKLKSKLKKIPFLTKILRNNKQKSKDLETVCEKKSCIPLQLAKSDYQISSKPAIQDAFCKALLHSGLRPIGDYTTSALGKDPSVASFLFVNARPTPDSTPNEITPSPTISARSLPPIEKDEFSKITFHHEEEPIVESTEEEEVERPDVEIRLIRDRNEDDDDGLSSTSSSSSGDQNKLINIQIKDRLKELQDRQFLIDTRLLLGDDQEEIPTSTEATDESPLPSPSSPSPLSSPSAPLSLLDDEPTVSPPRVIFSTPTITDLSSGDRADDDDDDDEDDEKLEINRSNINIELIIMNKSSENLCGDGEDAITRNKFDVNNIAAAPCLYQLGLRKPRSKMVMVGPVLQPLFNENYLPTIFSEDFLDDDDDDDEEEQSDCGCATTTVCVIAEIRIDDNDHVCCQKKMHFCGLFYDCGGGDEETDDDDDGDKLETSEISSYYESDGLSTARESVQKKRTIFRLNSSTDLNNTDYVQDESQRSSRFTVKTFYYSEISPQASNFGSKDIQSGETGSTRSDSQENEEDSVDKELLSSKSDLREWTRSSNFTIQTFYCSDITSKESNCDSKSENMKQSLCETEKSPDSNSNYVESSGYSPKSSNFTVKTFYYSENTTQELHSESKDLECDETTVSSSCFASKTSHLSNFCIENMESSGNNLTSSNELPFSSEFSNVDRKDIKISRDFQKSDSDSRRPFSSEVSHVYGETIEPSEDLERFSSDSDSQMPFSSEVSFVDEENIKSSGDLERFSSDSDTQIPFSSKVSHADGENIESSGDVQRFSDSNSQKPFYSEVGENIENSEDLQEFSSYSDSQIPFSSETLHVDGENIESSEDLQRFSPDSDSQMPFSSEVSNIVEENIENQQRSSEYDSQKEVSPKSANFAAYFTNSINNNIDFDSTAPESTEEETTMSEKSVILKQRMLNDFCGFSTFQFRCNEESDDDDDEPEVMIVKLKNSEKNLNISKSLKVPSHKYQDTCGLYTNFNKIVLNNNTKQQDLNSGASSSLRKRNFRRNSSSLIMIRKSSNKLVCENVTKKCGFYTDNYIISNNNNDDETDET